MFTDALVVASSVGSLASMVMVFLPSTIGVPHRNQCNLLWGTEALYEYADCEKVYNDLHVEFASNYDV